MPINPTSINFDAAFGIHEQALTYRGQRSAVIANNIANADTPNYKARDIKFQDALRQYDQRLQQQASRGLVMTNEHHMQATATGLDEDLLYEVPTQPSIDGNTVETQIEQAKFSENAMQFQASLTLLNGKMRSLMSAIRGE